jgi:hypothetical protein
VHLSGAPYHPATNGAAERLVGTFKQSLRKSQLPPKKALQEFLMQRRQTPTSSGYSPSLEWPADSPRIDTLLPSPPHIAQQKQCRDSAKSGKQRQVKDYKVGDPVYAIYVGPKKDGEPRWVPATVVRRRGARTFDVRVYPKGAV